MDKKKILYVISSPAMSSYATGFLNALENSILIEPYVVIFVEFTDNRTKESIIIDFNLLSLNSKNIEIIKYSKSKLGVHVFQTKYAKLISFFSKLHKLHVIHFLTQDTFIAYNLSILKDIEIYYTVHDLEHHEAKVSLLGKFKRYFLLTIKDKWIIKNVNNLVTSSDHQVASLKSLYPNKQVYQHNMPSLITPGIMKGVIKVKELNDIKDYVLFFGRIEFYKGIEILYSSFLNTKKLSDVHLVIAGKGSIYFERDVTKETNVHFVNRFIHDEEMNDLFSNAKLVVLPYTSATQSAVTSLSYFYKKPMIVSDILGLKDSVIDQKTALLFDPTKENDLYLKIVRLLEDDLLYNKIILNQTKYQEIFYGVNKLTCDIESIYH
jgi:glycosyltransferase involved in cell wall biosynthesis